MRPRNVYALSYGRVSLNPAQAVVSFGTGRVINYGINPPLRHYHADLGSGESNSGFSLGFTIPQGYVPDTALSVVILWESSGTQGDFVLRPDFLFRTRPRYPKNAGVATACLTASDALTVFALNGAGIRMRAPPNKSAAVRFKIPSMPSEFSTLRSGDVINFGIYRSVTQFSPS